MMGEKWRRRPLRVAHLDTGRSWRGGQAQVMLLMQGLARHGVTSALLAPPGPLLARARGEDFAAWSWDPGGDVDVFALGRAARLLARFRPDVAHCHTARAHAVGVPAARLAGARAVVVSRRVAVPVGRGPWSGLKYRLPVDRYLCVSRSVVEVMRRGGVSAAKLALVPSGVTLGPVSTAADLRGLAGLAPGAVVVATVAALTAEKRHEDLLEAAPCVITAVPETHLVWIGDGPRRPWLERRRAALGLEGRVHLLGHRADARGLVAQADVVALASELEGISTSLLDAQVAGVPVVATAVGGIPEVVEHGVTGWLVPPREPPALAAALIEVLTRRDLARERAAKAQVTAREFHVDRMVERTLVEYRAVLEHGRSAA